jgi:hypothetical protein
LQKNSAIFTDDDATVVRGAGKNMVLSIRFWMRACQMIDLKALAKIIERW